MAWLLYREMVIFMSGNKYVDVVVKFISSASIVSGFWIVDILVIHWCETNSQMLILYFKTPFYCYLY